MFIKFQQGEFATLRKQLLADLSQEHFAVLFGKRESLGAVTTINVVESRFLRPEHYKSQSIAHLSLDKRHMVELLSEVTCQLPLFSGRS